MSKVLVERPRAGSSYGEQSSRHARRNSKRVLRLVDHDEVQLDNKASMKAHIRGHPKLHNKDLNENLKPFRRFLESRVGRKWDDVYSEIMEGINLNNAVQYHVWQHLIQFGEVETKTFMENGVVMVAGRGTPHSADGFYRDSFYVHPETGILCKSKASRYTSWRTRRDEFLNEVRYIDPSNKLLQYHKVDGIWYEYRLEEAKVEYRPVNNLDGRFLYNKPWIEGSPSSRKMLDDIARSNKNGYMSHYEDTYSLSKEYLGGEYVIASKRQISGKEIRRIESLISAQKKKKAA